MGSDVSKGKNSKQTARYGDILIVTDQNQYTGGDTVSGKVHLNLIDTFPGNQLFIRFKGYEWTSFTTVERMTGEPYDGPHIRLTHEAGNNIVKEVVPVYKWETLLPGQYTIPFSFKLPENLPNTFYQLGGGYYAIIDYQIEAYLKPHNEKYPKMKYKHAFLIRSVPPLTQHGASIEKETALRTCCSNGGSNLLKASIEKNFFDLEESLKVMVELDNTKSKLANKNIVVKLIQKLSLQAGEREQQKTLVITENKIPGIKKGQTLKDQAIMLHIPSRIHQEIHTYNFPPVCKRRAWILERGFQLPTNTRGKLISSEFFLEISSPMSGCSATTSKIELPLDILVKKKQQLALVDVSDPPENWKPVVMEPVVLPFRGQVSIEKEGGSNTKNEMVSDMKMI